jgi:hypothetical protein
VTLTGAGSAPAGARAAPPTGGGVSSPAGAPAPAPGPAAVKSVPLAAVAGLVARPLAVRSLSLARRISIAQLRLRGLRAAMRLPAGTAVVRFAVYRARGGRRVGRALAIGYRVPSRTGAYRLVLRERSLLRKLTRGSYVLQVRPGRSRRDLGAVATVRFTVTR